MRLKSVLAVAAFLILSATPAFAETGMLAPEVATWIPLASGLGLGLAAFGGAFAQGKIISSALDAIARNPGASGKMFIVWFLGVAFVESLVVYSLVISLQMVGRI